jgi:hypothetical protein
MSQRILLPQETYATPIHECYRGTTLGHAVLETIAQMVAVATRLENVVTDRKTAERVTAPQTVSRVSPATLSID